MAMELLPPFRLAPYGKIQPHILRGDQRDVRQPRLWKNLGHADCLAGIVLFFDAWPNMILPNFIGTT